MNRVGFDVIEYSSSRGFRREGEIRTGIGSRLLEVLELAYTP
jgi:hypothetical protein